MKQHTIRIGNKIAINRTRTAEKPAIAGSLAIILTAYVLSCFLFLIMEVVSPFAQPFIFLLAGLFHLHFIRERLQFQPFASEWLYTLAATGLILLLCGGAVLFVDDLPFSLILACASAFLLPFTLSELWRMNLRIAYEGVKVWQPAKEHMVNYPSFYFDGTPIRLRVIQGQGFRTETIKFNVSKKMKLENIFYDLAKNKSKMAGRQVLLTDTGRRYFHWVFFTPDWLVLNRTLDPQKTLAENGLKENAVIYAQKVFYEDIPMLKNNKHQLEYDDNTRL